MNLEKLERYLRVNLLGPGPRLIKKIYRAAVSQRFRNTGLNHIIRVTPCHTYAGGEEGGGVAPTHPQPRR